MTDVDLDSLKIELDSDPEGLGLTAMDNPTASEKLNELNASFTVPRGTVNGQELQMAVDGAEYIALSAERQRGWGALISAGDGQVDVNNPAVVAQATVIWGAGVTLTALAALQNRTASRAEDLFGAGVSVSYRDVAKARLYY